MRSSSGGIFSDLAVNIIGKGGVVSGAAFSDDNHKVEHILVTQVDELYRLRGSKYVQSNSSIVYCEIRRLLLAGKVVLFSGTLCQVAGLKAFLGKEYDNLITVDIVCHGVPSPGVWDKYLSGIENKHKSTVDKVNFRNKHLGWKMYSVCYSLSNGKLIENTHYEDLFMRGFIYKNLYLRPSCYQCKFKTFYRNSDITLGDFWGIGKICPEMDDNKGTSLVISNTKKGNDLLNSISDKNHIQVVDTTLIPSLNPALVSSATEPGNRNMFFEDFIKGEPDKVLKKYCDLSIAHKIKHTIKKIRLR